MVLQDPRDHKACRAQEALRGRLPVEDLDKLYQGILVKVELSVYQVHQAHLVERVLAEETDRQVLVVKLAKWVLRVLQVLSA